LNSQASATQSVTVAAVFSYAVVLRHRLKLFYQVAATGTLTGTGGSTDRVTLTFTPSAGTLTLTVVGTEQNVQLEDGAFATPPIITTGTSANRNADVVVISGVDASEWWNVSEGTFVVEYEYPQSAVSASPFLLSNSTTATTVERIGLIILGVSTAFQVRSGGNNYTTTAFNSNIGRNKVAFSFDGATAKVSPNGANVLQVAAPVTPTITTALIGSFSSASGFLNGYVPKILYYTTAVSDAKLQELSTL